MHFYLRVCGRITEATRKIRKLVITHIAHNFLIGENNDGFDAKLTICQQFPFLIVSIIQMLPVLYANILVPLGGRYTDIHSNTKAI